MNRRTFLALLLIVIASGCSTMRTLPSKGIIGTWKGYDENSSYTLNFRADNTLTGTIENNDTMEFTARYVIDNTAKPATLDIIGVEMQDRKFDLAGIIQLKKGKLHIDSNSGETGFDIERPTEFGEKTLILERIK